MKLLLHTLLLVAFAHQALAGAKAKRDFFTGRAGTSAVSISTTEPSALDDGVNVAESDFDSTRTFRRRPVAHASVIKNQSQRRPDGSYNYEFLTDNGIHRQETSEQVGLDRVVRGSYSYIGPDGQTYSVNYVADRNGYRAYGAHLPTQPDAVANIINQAQQGILSTTGEYVPLHSTTATPIYNRRPGHYVTSTTPSPHNHHFVSTTFGTPVTTPSGFIYTSGTGSPTAFVSTTSTPFTVSPLAQGFGGSSTINPFNQNAFNSIPTSTPSPFAGVTTASPFDNDAGTINITPLPQTFVGQRFPTSSSASFGIPSGFQSNNGFAGNGQNNGFAFNGQKQPNNPFASNNFHQNGGFDNFNTLNAFASNPFQQLPFNQPIGQFNGGHQQQLSHQQPLGGIFGARQQFDAASVQPLAANQGFGASIASIPPSAFDRVNG